MFETMISQLRNHSGFLYRYSRPCDYCPSKERARDNPKVCNISLLCGTLVQYPMDNKFEFKWKLFSGYYTEACGGSGLIEYLAFVLGHAIA
jgi:hypothetical protein